MPNIEYLLPFSGVLTGFLIGVTGVGGGTLMLPILLIFFGVAPVTVVGTDLWFAAITKLFAIKIHHQYGLIDWQVVTRLLLGSIPASLISLLYLKLIPSVEEHQYILKSFVSFTIFFTSIALLFKNKLLALDRNSYRGSLSFVSHKPLLTVVSGFFLGILVTLTSIGAGALGAVVLSYLYPLRMKPSRLIATDIAHAVPLAIIAGSGHLFLGNVDFDLLWKLLLGSIPAVIAGSMVSSKFPQNLLRMILALVLMVISLRLIIES